MNRDLLRRLKPINYGNHDPEPLPDYLRRVGPLLPNFPDSVVAQWLHRHYNDAVSSYGWLGFEGLRFTKEAWPLPRLKADIASFKNDTVDRIGHWTQYFRDPAYASGNWLIQRMKELGTWPEPIMVLRNDSGLALPNGLQLGTPFHLVEGHHRLGFLMAIATDHPARLASAHNLWILDADPAAISHKWPNV